MTKKQVIASLRSRVEARRDQFENLRSVEAKLNDDYQYRYHCGCVDVCDLILEFLCDYD